MAATTMDVLTVLKRHENEIKENYHVKRIGLFGSYAKGFQNEESDVDILVEFQKPTFDNFIELSFYLEDLFGKKLIF